jgi:hypothetical protein
MSAPNNEGQGASSLAKGPDPRQTETDIVVGHALKHLVREFQSLEKMPVMPPVVKQDPPAHVDDHFLAEHDVLFLGFFPHDFPDRVPKLVLERFAHLLPEIVNESRGTEKLPLVEHVQLFQFILVAQEFQEKKDVPPEPFFGWEIRVGLIGLIEMMTGRMDISPRLGVQPGLAPEMIVDGGNVAFGLPGNFLHRGLVKSLGGKEIGSDLQDALSGLLPFCTH